MGDKIVRTLLWLSIPLNAYFAFKGNIFNALVVPFVIGCLWYGYYIDRKIRAMEIMYDNALDKLFRLR